jgi:hypothetical protein
LEDTDDEHHQDSVPLTPNHPKVKAATERLWTTPYKPPRQILLKVPTRYLSALSSLLPLGENPLSMAASCPVSSQQRNNSSESALMPITFHFSPRNSQQKRGVSNIDSKPREAKKTKQGQMSRGIGQFLDPTVRRVVEQASIMIRWQILFNNPFPEDVEEMAAAA